MLKILDLKAKQGSASLAFSGIVIKYITNFSVLWPSPPKSNLTGYPPSAERVWVSINRNDHPVRPILRTQSESSTALDCNMSGKTSYLNLGSDRRRIQRAMSESSELRCWLFLPSNQSLKAKSPSYLDPLSVAQAVVVSDYEYTVQSVKARLRRILVPAEMPLSIGSCIT